MNTDAPVVGAPRGDDGGTNAGEAYILFGGAFGRGTTPVAPTGTASADLLIGGLRADTLTGAGDDRMVVGSAAFRSVDGGSGRDTLSLGGAARRREPASRVIRPDRHAGSRGPVGAIPRTAQAVAA
jgi:Ca2+-binding RTX toxin-like protein